MVTAFVKIKFSERKKVPVFVKWKGIGLGAWAFRGARAFGFWLSVSGTIGTIKTIGALVN